jgi:hypothetical protein
MEARILVPEALSVGTSLDWESPLGLETGKLETQFEDRPHPFLVFEYTCDSPDCPCREVTLDFVEVVPDGEKAKEGLRFQFRFDVDRGQVMEGHRVPGAAAPLVEEFSSGLDAKLVSWLRRRFDSTREHVRRGARFEMSAEEILRGDLVPWTEVFSEEGSIVRGGSCCTSSFVDGEVEWFVEDLYCLNPSCDCRLVSLLFHRVPPESTQARHGFTAKVRISGKLAKIEPHDCGPAEAREIFERWRSQEPDLATMLVTRYREIRTVGHRITERARSESSRDLDMAPASSSKVGRNAPCPCGSGKKHKRCCGG